ncbi:PKD domain-containing protein [Flavobacterium sp. JLP]|uniref:PKD domain-containing protein n=1 Tax=unclassified Flavobacterium TaxID=196869 RepID=UPI00188D44B0|nr:MULTISPECIES: PKD domain-containing protein [unclassified Flavobacterium]MBF4493943.1 PKD domain-containing protein [Flavobacterium sp. MR2016-29]MBF4506788.1 PKD domain-containing protein [Flavobacterium sp. JLP]
MNLNINLKKSVFLMLAVALGTLTSCDDEVGNGNGLAAANVDASFTVTPVTGAVNTYLLTAQPKGVISSKWNIGDGDYAGKMNETITLPDAGTYTVTHTAIGAGGTLGKATAQIVVAKTDPLKGNLVQGGSFETAADQAKWTVLNLSATGAAFWSYANKSATIHSPGGWAQEGIYQAIDVIKDKEYTIDMLVSCPSGSDETWFEVYAGTSAPKSGVEYKDNKVMGLSTWDGCAKAAFSGKLSVVGCVKNDVTGTVSNTVKFAQSGKIYLLIRSGGNTFTKDGITVSKIELRGK